MRLLNKIFAWLYGIGIDRYLHIVFGVLIACITLIAMCWLPIWANMIISAVVVVAAALLKDLVIDDNPDWVDIVCTIVGGLLVWLPVIVV